MDGGTECSAAKKSSVKFEDVLEVIGSFRRAQIQIFILTSLFDVPLGWYILFFLYGAYNPGFYCVSHEAVALSVILNNTGGISEVLEEGNGSINRLWTEDQCTVNGERCHLIIFKQGYNTLVTEFSLVCDKAYIPWLCTTLMMIGIFVGASVGGQLADSYGRRYVLYAYALLLCTCQYLQAAATCWQMLAAIRCFGGVAAGGLLCVGFVVPMEVIGGKWRTLCGSIGFWQIGNIAFSGLGYCFNNWRHLAIASAAIPTPLLLSFFVVPESPRWLLQKDRMQEASHILNKMAKQNGRGAADIDLLLSIEREPPSGVNVFQLFRNRISTIRTLVMCLLWFSCSMIYYGLSMNAQPLGSNVHLNILILGVAELVFVLTVIYTAYRLGRRPAVFGYLAIAASCLCISVALGQTKSGIQAVPYLNAAGRGATIAAWSVAYLLTAELFPTVTRSLAGGICSVAGRIGGVVAPQAAYLSAIHPAIPGVVFGLFSFVTALIVFIVVPETKGRPLPDVLPPYAGCCGTIPLDEQDTCENLGPSAESDQFNTVDKVTQL